MNSLPLSAPDGTVYAYACGECQLVSLGFRSDLKARAEASKETADACCLCLACKVVKVITFHPLCDACFQKRRDAEAAAQLKRVEKALNPEAALKLLDMMRGYCQAPTTVTGLKTLSFFCIKAPRPCCRAARKDTQHKDYYTTCASPLAAGGLVKTETTSHAS